MCSVNFHLVTKKIKPINKNIENLHLVTIPSQQTRFPKFLADNVLGETCFDPKLNKKRNFWRQVFPGFSSGIYGGPCFFSNNILFFPD